MKKCTTADRLKQIMSERNLKQVDILNLTKPYCEKHKVKLGRNDISQYVSGKVTPRQTKIYILAEALNVSEAWLMGFDVHPERDDIIAECPICGLRYSKSDYLDCKEHDEYHKLFLAAKKHFPELLNKNDARELWEKCLNIRDSEDTATDKRLNACIGIIQYYFSRSLSSQQYNLTHPSFKEFASMILNQEQLRDNFGVSYNRLVSQFGKKEGLKEGRTRYQCAKKSTNKTDKSLNFDNIVPITTKKIPIIGEIACGEPIFTNEEYESYVEVGASIKADYGLRAHGDSMINARIMDGDIVFIQKQETVNNGEIAAVVVEDRATLKRIYYYPQEGRIILQAENPAYAPLIYEGEELNNIHILGKAIAFQSDVK